MIIRPDKITQGSFGFHLALPFDDLRFLDADPINADGDTFRVEIVRPDGSQIVKTSDFEFDFAGAGAGPQIGVPISAGDLELRGRYEYQVIETSSSAEIKSSVESFEVLPGLIAPFPIE